MKARSDLGFLLVLGSFMTACSKKIPVDLDVPQGCLPPAGNHAPRFTALGDTTVAIGDTLALVAAASDPDGDIVHYRAVVALGAWRRPFPLTWFNRETGAFFFVPRPGDVSLQSVTFHADDGKCGRDTLTVNIRVIAPAPSPAMATSAVSTTTSRAQQRRRVDPRRSGWRRR